MTRITKKVIEELVNDNVIYAEIRFVPILHAKEELSLEEIIDSVLSGIKNLKIKVGIILCMIRGNS